MVSSDDIEEVKSVKRSFIKDNSKVRESKYDKTLNDAFGDDDEEEEPQPKHEHVNAKEQAMKDKLREIGVKVPGIETETPAPEKSSINTTKAIDEMVADSTKKSEIVPPAPYGNLTEHLVGDDDDDEDDMIYMPQVKKENPTNIASKFK